MNTSEAMALQARISEHLTKIASIFKNPRITLIVRNPDLGDGDVLLTDDDPQKAIEAIQRLSKRNS